MKSVSLFSGIGGFDLGFQRAGIECAAVCEIDKNAQSVLLRRFPEAITASRKCRCCSRCRMDRQAYKGSNTANITCTGRRDSRRKLAGLAKWCCVFNAPPVMQTVGLLSGGIWNIEI